MAEPAFGQRIQPVRVAAGIERVGHQLRIVMVANGEAVLGKDDRAEFEIEADLQDPCRFQQRPQRLDRLCGRDLVRRQACREQAGSVAGVLVAERNIAGIVWRERERNAANLRLHRID